MTTIIEENFANKTTYMELARTQLEKWRSGLEKLESETKKFPAEVQAAYRREIGILNSQLDGVETAFEKMGQADSQHWDEATYNWGKTAAEFWQSFITTAGRIQNEHSVPLGWVQGLTDTRMHDSAGWAEGFGSRPEGSQGWAEGMGQRGSGSKGWAEGYEDRSSSG
jgi:hypothetical protein